MTMMGDPHLTDLMNRYGFSIVEMQALDSGSSPWAQGAGGKVAFDSGGRWRQVALHVQREMTCEQCSAPFAYTFQVVEEGGSHRGQHVLSVEALNARWIVICDAASAARTANRCSNNHAARSCGATGGTTSSVLRPSVAGCWARGLA